MQKHGVVRRALVIAPLRVCSLVWPREAAKWADFAHLRVHVLHGKGKTEGALVDPDIDVLVINPEGLPWLEEAAPRAWSAKRSSSGWPEMLVVDESTKFKHAGTQRFKILRRMLDRFARRYILTGTPAPNGLLDLFGQVFILDGGGALGRYVTHYRERYFQPVGFGGYTWVPRPYAEQEIYEKLRPLTLRLEAKDYLQLPEKIEAKLPVEFGAEARAQYDELEAEMVLELRSGDVVASGAAGLVSKCHQFVGGHVYAETEAAGERVSELVHTHKLEALRDLIDELNGHPLLIAYSYRHELDTLRGMLEDRFGERIRMAEFANGAPYIGGGASPKAVEAAVNAWNAGELPALLVHPASAGHGLNLQAGGRHLCWYSLTWDLELYEQLVARLWRQGQEGRVFIYQLVAQGTVDETIAAALKRKGRAQSALLAALKERHA